MAELDFGAETQDELAGAPEQTADEPEQMTEHTEGGASSEDRFTDEVPSDPNDPQFKHWQAAYTKTRQRDRERYGQVEGEHKQFGDVLRNFYTSDEYALQVLRQRFPQLAGKLSLDGTPRGGEPTGTRTGGQTATSGLVSALEQELGSDLAFLAPRLGPVLEKAIQSAIGGAMKPIEDRTQQQQAAARKQQEDQLLAEMDGAHPGWEARYGKDMQALDAFLNSEDLTHPKFGSKYQLLMKLVNPDLARVDAARSMGQAARQRVATGRAGSPSQPDTSDQIRTAKSNSDAFRLAAEAAMREVASRA